MRRYVDVDLAIDEIIKDMCGVPDIDEGLSTAISELRLMPTADVVEVVHGEWVLNDDQVYECKDCGYVPSFDGYTYFNYCPICSAKMKGANNGCNY